MLGSRGGCRDGTNVLLADSQGSLPGRLLLPVAIALRNCQKYSAVDAESLGLCWHCERVMAWRRLVAIAFRDAQNIVLQMFGASVVVTV